MSLGRDILTQILGDQVQIITLRNNAKWAIEKSDMLSKLSEVYLEKLLDKIQINNYRKGDVVIKKKKTLDRIYICIGGGLRTVKIFLIKI